MKSQIICLYICQPIPVRKFDWIAYRDGEEEDGLRGYGETAEMATQDLLKQEEEAGFDIEPSPIDPSL